jgi:benzoate transport
MRPVTFETDNKNHRHPQEIIDNSPMSTVQVLAVLMCILLTALDGFDVLAISFAAPGISADWGVGRAALGVVLSMELIGMGIGSIVLGKVADQVGRRPTILGCLVLMSAGMLGAGLATGITSLSAYRLVTGFGIGGMLASTNAMAAEFSNRKYRNMAVIMMAGGFPLGATLGGAVASKLLAVYDWRSVFFFGASITAVFIVLVWFYLQESISHLAHKGTPAALAKINRILTRMKHATVDALPLAEESAEAGTEKLFSPRLRRTTVLLAVAYFAHIMTFYFFVKWIPKLVVDLGFAASAAGGVLVWANLGGVLGCVLLAILSHRYAVRTMVMVVLAGGAAMIVMFGQGQENIEQLAMIAAVAGFFTNAAVVGIYSLLAQAFPTELRASGTGFVIGVGRGGAALGPIAAGLMFSIGYGLQSVALLMACGSLIAIFALWFLKTDTLSAIPPPQADH